MATPEELRLMEAWAKEVAELAHEEYKKVNPKMAALQEEIEARQRAEGRIAHMNRNGEAISFLAVSFLGSKDEYRIVEQTRVHKTRISTVWTGMNCGIGPTPLVYETMIFSPHEQLHHYKDKYGSEEAAKAGHAAIVKKVEEWYSRDLGNFDDE